jgi:hypothetical protein
MANNLNNTVGVTETTRKLGVLPRVLSDLFHAEKLDRDRCPIVGKRRVIPADYVPIIKAKLRELGKVKDG